MALCVHKLIGAAFSEYARLLRSVGMREGAALWASKAGGAGEELLEELFQKEATEAEPERGPDEEQGGLLVNIE